MAGPPAGLWPLRLALLAAAAGGAQAVAPRGPDPVLQLTAWGSGPPEICTHSVHTEEGSCTLISQTLCKGATPLKFLQGDHSHCMRPKDSCALVGSSQHLLNEKWGELIDSHEAVIRINAAPTGAEPENAHLAQHVGNRTDVRFVNMFGYMPKSEKKDPVCTFLHEPGVPCGRTCWRDPDTCESPCDLTKLTCRTKSQTKFQTKVDWGRNFVFLDHVHGGIADRIAMHPTAGFKALSYAIRTCRHVSVFGFGPSCDGVEGSRYYEDRVVPSKWHHYSNELDLLKKASRDGIQSILPPELQHWVRAGNVTLHLPACAAGGASSAAVQLRGVHKPAAARHAAVRPHLHKAKEPADTRAASPVLAPRPERPKHTTASRWARKPRPARGPVPDEGFESAEEPRPLGLVKPSERRRLEAARRAENMHAKPRRPVPHARRKQVPHSKPRPAKPQAAKLRAVKLRAVKPKAHPPHKKPEARAHEAQAAKLRAVKLRAVKPPAHPPHKKPEARAQDKAQ